MTSLKSTVFLGPDYESGRQCFFHCMPLCYVAVQDGVDVKDGQSEIGLFAAFILGTSDWQAVGTLCAGPGDPSSWIFVLPRNRGVDAGSSLAPVARRALR